jgi:hypothetical protein
MAAAFPRQPGDQRHKPHETKVLCRKPMLMTANAHEVLISVIVTDGCNQDAARRKPLDESCRDLCCGGGHDYTVVR